jgi:hypothetical protein
MGLGMIPRMRFGNVGREGNNLGLTYQVYGTFQGSKDLLLCHLYPITLK